VRRLTTPIREPTNRVRSSQERFSSNSNGISILACITHAYPKVRPVPTRASQPVSRRITAYFWPRPESGLSSDQTRFVGQTWRSPKPPAAAAQYSCATEESTLRLQLLSSALRMLALAS
jgi:hypothetical protein